MKPTHVVEVSETHPSLERLHLFGQGLLSDEESDAIERHVAECNSCCEALVAAPSDTLLSRLRQGQTWLGRASGAAATLPAEPQQPIAPPAELLDHPRYRILESIGRGGMGVVFRAEHRLMQRSVALKVIDSRLIRRPEAVQRFRQEVLAASKLDHENVVMAHDAEQIGGLTFLVTEFVPGESLEKTLARRGRLPVAEACECIRQAARGLQAAVEHQLVHRDIKPANLIVTPQGRVKILDFGLARFVQDEAEAAIGGGAESSGLQSSGLLLGTPDYIAPEQAADSHRADARADIYSLGCTLYHLLAGQPPFPSGSVLEKLAAHRDQTPRPLGELRPELPPPLIAVVERMMAKDPAARWQSPAEIATALQPFCQPISPAAARGGRVRRAALVAALSIAALAVIALATAMLWQPADRYSDEFKGTALSADWRTLDAATPEQVQVADGKLVIEPRDGSSWYENSRGPFVYQPVSGDFCVTAHVAARNRQQTDQPPRQHYNSAGLLARDPRSRSGDENWLLVSLGCHDGNHPLAAKAEITRRSASQIEIVPAARFAGQLRLARIESTFYLLKKLDGESDWSLLKQESLPDWSSTLQVGLEAGSYLPQSPSDLRAEFDHVHFRIPWDETDLYRD